MKELVIEFINDSKIVIQKEYLWIDDIFNKLTDKEDFIKIDNYIIAKNEIRKIEINEREEN